MIQRLRAVLTSALARQSLRVRFAAGEAPEWLESNQNIASDGGSPIVESDLRAVLAFVLPGQVIPTSGELTGALNVGAQGILKVRVLTTPVLTILFYPPLGYSLFNEDMKPAGPVMAGPRPDIDLGIPKTPDGPPNHPTEQPTPRGDSKIPFTPDPGLFAQPIIANRGAQNQAEANLSMSTPQGQNSVAQQMDGVKASMISSKAVDNERQIATMQSNDGPTVGVMMPPPPLVNRQTQVVIAQPVDSIHMQTESNIPLHNSSSIASSSQDSGKREGRQIEVVEAKADQMFRVTVGPKKSVGKESETSSQNIQSSDPQIPSVNAFHPVAQPLEHQKSSSVSPAGPPPIGEQSYRAESSAVIAGAKAAEEPTIVFANSEASEGSLSHGNNPIDGLLREMVKLKASDMHLTIGQPVIFRIHGDITRMSQDHITSDMMEKFVLPTMPPRNRGEFSKINDSDYAYELSGIGRFRMNVFRDRNGVGAVLRHIPSQILTAEQLNLPPAILKLCTLNKGLVLVTGPTGSGKSTTLAAMIDTINKSRKEHILTIEDPIEFVHPQQQCLVNQREVHKHTGSFARALKAALREDPDIVLIGEMRDLETIAIAIETAETGHLVFGTLHTTTAMSTVDRIIDQFPADRQAQIRTMLSSSLRGVIAQTLLKKKGGGRVAAHEILVSNDAVAAMIREGKIQHLGNHMMTQKQDGNQLLNDALLKLVQDGVADAQEAYFKAVDKNSFLMMAKQRGIKIIEAA